MLATAKATLRLQQLTPLLHPVKHSKMSTFDKAALAELLTKGHQRQMVATKHLTLAFAGTYIVATTLAAKPVLVWEDPASSYGRYYVPVESLHPSIKGQGNDGAAKNGSNGASKDAVRLETIETLQGKGADAWAAAVEKLSIGDRSTTWARFTQGPFKDFIRFEPKEMGTTLLPPNSTC